MHLKDTSITANVDGPRDATLCRVNYIVLHIKCN